MIEVNVYSVTSFSSIVVLSLINTIKFLLINEKGWVKALIAGLSSDIYWWWYTITSNLRDLNPSDIWEFPFPKSAIEDSALHKLGTEYIEDLKRAKANFR